jgi:nucleoside-diphosphate-sugar epimerase/phytoene/squalene synthetase
VNDRAFCDRMLPGVSRTFALSIQNLPPDLRDAVCVSYLLCRVVDTVEDDRRLPPPERQALFDAFDAALAAAAMGDGSVAPAFEATSEAHGLGPTKLEAELCTGAAAVFRAFAALPEVQRQAILPHVAEMSKGMREYSIRADVEGGLRLRDVPDLERYCYFVAGTVGELLTDLFQISCPVSPAVRRELEARAVSFGLGLQLVNILKDVAEDAVRGDCFLPVGTAKAYGLDLSIGRGEDGPTTARVLDATERPKALALLRALSSRAREHLVRAEEYTLLWPVSAAGSQIRLFCAVPLALALGTLREVELGEDALRPDRAPTVSRAFVMAVFEAAVGAATAPPAESDAALRALFDRSRAGVAGRPPRPTATLESVVPPSAVPSRGGPPVSEGPMSEKKQPPGLQPRRELGGKILVTGAAGHVGANLVFRLLQDGHDVRVLLRDRSHDAAIEALEQETGKKLERVYGDLREADAVNRAVRGADNVFHVAARVSTLSGSPKDLRDLYDCNVVGTANVLRAAGDTGVKRTVVTGSLSAVGYDLDDPSKVSDESQPFYPFTEHLPYGRTKSLVEHEVLKACVEGVDALVATSCAVLGPWDYKPSRMGRTLLDFAHGKLRGYPPGGFDFVNVRDLVDGHILAMERGRIGQRYILSTQFATVDELMDIFEEVTGRPRPRFRVPVPLMNTIAHVSTFVLSTFFPDVPQRFTPAAVRLLNMQRKADTSKAQRELGYKPTEIRSAIHEAYAHFARRGLAPSGPSLSAKPGGAPHAVTERSSSDREGAAA